MLDYGKHFEPVDFSVLMHGIFLLEVLKTPGFSESLEE